MSAAWVDRIGVATIVLLAGGYLARRAVRRVAAAFAHRPAAGACGPECGCGGDAALD